MDVVVCYLDDLEMKVEVVYVFWVYIGVGGKFV